MQTNLSAVLNDKHGIKVVLSLLSETNKHLPPHARELLSPAERRVRVRQTESDVAEQDETESANAPSTNATEILGLSKKSPERRRCVIYVR
jgi:hypothetical protein